MFDLNHAEQSKKAVKRPAIGVYRVFIWFKNHVEAGRFTRSNIYSNQGLNFKGCVYVAHSINSPGLFVFIESTVYIQSRSPFLSQFGVTFSRDTRPISKNNGLTKRNNRALITHTTPNASKTTVLHGFQGPFDIKFTKRLSGPRF